MCGLIAFFNFKEKLNLSIEALNSYRDTMFNRGPDDKGYWLDTENKIYLGHRRLSILDTSKKGVQPILDSEKKISIIFNGEIYNFKKLKIILQSKGYTFLSGTDTEVVLYMYKHFGESFVEYLEGMFAIVIYDSEKKHVLAYRDRFGIKPLYIYHKNSFFVLCSQVKPLLNVKNIDLSYSDQGHISFLMWGSVSEPNTLYKYINSVETGTYIKINKNGLFEKKYFDLKKYSFEEKNSSLEESLFNTIEKHTISDVPICTFLSSGIDSTTILENLNKIKNISLNTVNLSFEYNNNFIDETGDSETIAKIYETNHYKTKITNEDFHLNKENIFNVMDQPSIDGINTYFISKFTKENNFKVALSGLGADEIFRGYDLFRQLPKLHKLMKVFPKEVKKSFSNLGYKLKNDKAKKLLISMSNADNIPWLYYIKRGIFMPNEINKYFDLTTVKNYIDDYIETSNQLCNENILSSLSKIEFSNYLKNQLLRDSDWAGMANSIEIRVPFVDVEFIKSISNFEMFNHNYMKKNLSTLIDNDNIKEILLKPKRGFYTPYENWTIDTFQSGYNSSKNWSLQILSKFTNYIN